MDKKVKKTQKVRKIKYKRVLLLLLIIVFFVFLIYKFVNKKITNIYIHNNKYIFVNSNDKFKEQNIIDIAKLSDYPSSILNPSSKIEERLLENVYIKDVKVSKKNIFEVHIYIYENRPLFYNSNTDKTVLETSDEVDEKFNIPILVNYVPDKVYKKFVSTMNTIDDSILSHVSEIKYDPNNVDEERFLFTMIDGNYVYITLNRFSLINNYLEIIKEINDKKGILYLDYGDHFVFE